MTTPPNLEIVPSSLELTPLQQETLDTIRRYIRAGGGPVFGPADIPVAALACYHLMNKGWLGKAADWAKDEPRFTLHEHALMSPDELLSTHEPHRYGPIPAGLFSNIIGYDDVKRAILRGLRSHLPIHHWLIGPPGSGKSAFLEELRRLQKSRWIDGATTTSRGIVNVLMSEDPDVLLIDEANHLEPEAQETLHAVASQGMIRLTNAYDRQEQETPVQIVMTSNTVAGTSDSFQSRFTMWHFRAYTREEFAAIAEGMLRTAGRPEHMGEFIAKRVWDHGGRDIRQVQDVAKLCRSMGEVDAFLNSPHLALR